jgi:uncharacterized protein YraI
MVKSIFGLRLLVGLVALLAIALSSAPARAEYGTEAWALTDLTLFQGPGNAYSVTGTITGRTEIQVERCAPRWCLVRQGHTSGWASRDHIGYGQEPNYPLTGPRLNYATGGTVCFYTGTHYSGTEYCFEAGFVARDLLLHGIDNAFASVRIPDRGSASVCRNRDFHSYCERVVASQPVLDQYLMRNVSSIRVH